MQIGKLNQVKDIFVMGSGGDESLSVGAIFSYLDYIGRGAEICPMESLYLGGDITTGEIAETVANICKKTPCNVIDNVSALEIAKRLAEGKIIGRVSGRMEFGARALGNRSILADPRSRETIRKINAKIKNRDFWMPFTPSMLPEGAKRFLDNPKDFAYPYMSVACETTEEGKKSLAAATHPADMTARPQIVDSNVNLKYSELIAAFGEITGVPALLNTSLNLHGYPIVRTCSDAAQVLLKSDLDGLLLGDTLVMKA